MQTTANGQPDAYLRETLVMCLAEYDRMEKECLAKGDRASAEWYRAKSAGFAHALHEIYGMEIYVAIQADATWGKEARQG